MKKIVKIVCIFITVLYLFSCVSTTVISSIPTESKVYINNEPVGVTPYKYSDTKISGSQTDLRLEKDGYESSTMILRKNEKVNGAAIVSGLLFGLWPFLWTMEYKPQRTIELRPLQDFESKKELLVANDSSTYKDKYQFIRDLYFFLEQGLLSETEYEHEKVLMLSDNFDKSHLKLEQFAILVAIQKIGFLEQKDFERVKVLVLAEQLVLTNSSFKKAESLISLHNDKLISKEEFDKELVKLFQLDGFIVGDKVVFRDKFDTLYKGSIVKINGNIATVKYTEKYLFGDKEILEDIKVSSLKIDN